MKNLKISLFLAVVAAIAAFGQTNTIVQTSLAASITQSQQTISVNSATGIVAPSTSAAGSSLWVQDFGQQMGEVMRVVSISGTTITVSRTSSRATAHANAAMVLVATAPNWFVAKDPAGSCTTAATYVTPVININTGVQWVCSAKTLTWIPGWGNHQVSPQINAATAVASVAGTTTIDGPLVHISGTNAITAFQPGIGWNGDPFCVIPDAAFTTTTGGTTVATTRVTAIALGSTAVANKRLCYDFDFTNAKFVPSY